MVRSSTTPLLDIVLITGMSGSGKSLALNALEDAGYYCVDNLPPELLPAFVRLQHAHHGHRVAIAIDARSAESLPNLPQHLEKIQNKRVQLNVLFLDASTATLVRRFSETRRRHPLVLKDSSGHAQALEQVIEHERELLWQLREHAHIIDTSNIRGPQLQAYVRDLIHSPGADSHHLSVIFQSFGFKYGLPRDADYVFDVRMLPNPFYDLSLRPLSGKDAAVQEFLSAQPSALALEEHLRSFLETWLPSLQASQRSYVTVAIGCTGGQHRSVYLVERISSYFHQHFGAKFNVLKRHRELDSVRV